MKLSRLIDPQFQYALRKLSAQELPLKSAFTLKGVLKQVNDELNKYDEVRGEALKRLGDKNEDGSLVVDESGNVQLNDENMKAFKAQIEDLLALNVNMAKVKVSDLGDKVNLSISELIQLEDIVVE